MQKTTFKFEAIVHDDASTDRSALIIKEYEEKYPDIIKPIYETENQHSKHDGSIGRIVNAACKGKYICWCEGDDYWMDPFKLQKQVDFLEAHPDYSLCFHNAVVMYSDTDNASKLFCPIEKSRKVSLEEIVRAWIIPSASILFKREILPVPKWPKGVVSGDMKLILTAADRGNIYYFKEVMSCYRLTYNTSSSTSRFKDKGEIMSEQKYKLLDFYNQNTLGRHENVLKKYIKYWKDYSKFYGLKKKNPILAFIRMPFFSMKKIYWRIFNNQPFA